MSERMTEDWALYEMASRLELSERLFKVRFTNEEKECLKEYLKIYEKHLDICGQIIKLEEKLPPHPQVNEVTIAYGELTKVSKLLNEEIQRLTKTATLQNVLKYRFAPQANAKNTRTAINKREQECRRNEKRERRNKILERIKTVSTSILWSVIGLFEFYLVYGIAFLVIALVYFGLSHIPVLGMLADWSLRIADNNPDMFAISAAVLISYGVLNITVDHCIKKSEAQRLTLMLIGIILAILNVLFLIINLIYNDSVLVNISLFLFGVVLFLYEKTK